MDVSTMALFFALLAVVAEGGGVVLIAALLGPAGGGDRIVRSVGPSALGLAAAIAVTAMGGSLYFSEVAHYTPCTLCWYQRTCMYPLAVVLTIAAIRRDQRVVPYGLALAGIGAA